MVGSRSCLPLQVADDRGRGVRPHHCFIYEGAAGAWPWYRRRPSRAGGRKRGQALWACGSGCCCVISSQQGSGKLRLRLRLLTLSREMLGRQCWATRFLGRSSLHSKHIGSLWQP